MSAPFVLVVGLPWSGKSFVCGVLHHLGVLMAETYFRSKDAEALWGYESYEDVWIHSDRDLDSRRGLEEYLAQRQKRSGPMGVKWPRVAPLVLEGVPRGCSVIACRRSPGEVLSATVAHHVEQGHSPKVSQAFVRQVALSHGMLEILSADATASMLELDFHEEIRRERVRKTATVYSIAAIAEVPVTAAAFEFAQREMP